MTELRFGFRLKDRQVYPASCEIDGAAGRMRIEPKAMAVLLILAEAKSEVVSREQLMAAVWPRGFVTDDVLTRCVGQLRRALGDHPRAPEFLGTVPRRGYRLVCSVEPLAAPVPQLAEEPSGTLLVLPFVNRCGESNAHLADGITELLIARLSSLQRFRVISRTTAMQFRGAQLSLSEINEQTGATWLVEGSVFTSPERIQVIAQLIEARSDVHLWAESYVREKADVLVIQNKIAGQVASSIQGILCDGAGTSPPLASWA